MVAEQQKQHHSERVDIRTKIDRAGSRLLRRHECDLSGDLSVGGGTGGRHPRDSEIGDLGHPLGVDQNVARTDVAVDNSERNPVRSPAAVRVSQRPRRAGRDEHRQIDRQPPSHPAVKLHKIVQGDSVHELHHKIVPLRTARKLIDLHDVLVDQVGDQLRLADEVPDEDRVRRIFRQQHLERHHLLESRLPDFLRLEDGTHAAFGNQPDDFITVVAIDHADHSHPLPNCADARR